MNDADRIPVSQDVYDLTPVKDRELLVVRSEEKEPYDAEWKASHLGNPVIAIEQMTPKKLEALKKELGLPTSHHARRYYSELCHEWFGSIGEGKYGEGLWLRQLAGEISGLVFHETIILSKDPQVTINIDYLFIEEGVTHWQDFKGTRKTKKLRIVKPYIERDYKVKMAWVKQLMCVNVEIVT